jgi:ATP-dependent helicase YprA (DUF1998 family)
MDVFALRDHLIADYNRYVASFMAIRDQRIKTRVDENLAAGLLWPDPPIGLNPAFEPGGWIDDLVTEGLLHEDAKHVFRTGKSAANPLGERMRMHRHQVDAIRAARDDRSYVLTTGTGSGKSLSYIVPIVDHVLREGSGKGVKAIVVYPMNALANSQMQELEKFLGSGFPGGKAPVRFERYTGQEDQAKREEILSNPPDVILTNYVMLELILTRTVDQRLVRAAQGLRFLVLDELHTYRGRQGADVALLVRRVREACRATQLQCVGTSATLATEGTHAEQRQAVADVASRLFGTEVRAEDVIGETLRRATPELDFTDPAIVSALAQRVRAGGSSSSTSFDDFVADPLSSWIETTFGVEDAAGRLVRVRPLPLDGDDGGAQRLASLTGVDVDICRAAIRSQLLAGNEVRRPDSPFPAFAFRLHQFISKGNTAFASLEAEPVRHISVTGQRFVPGHREKVLLPLAFCRLCGQDYYVVHRQLQHTESGAETILVGRDLGDQQGDDNETAGFLYISSDNPWPEDLDAMIERLPEDWVDQTPKGLALKSSRKKDLPVRLGVATDGSLLTNGPAPLVGWWLRAPFRFCLHCGVSYAGSTKRDFTKLTTLGSEGRSTATTVLSLSAVRSLRGDESLPPQARKLLSFTDNRQDASLQAGHFNDFVQVSMLRAALLAAVRDSGEEGLEHDRLTRAVFETLDLPFEDYAVDPDVEFQARRNTEKVFREVLGYRLYVDLRRGWRVTQPNLEQCGLLEIEYPALDEMAASESLWADAHPALVSATPAVRERVGRVLLDYLRRELAIKVEYLDRDEQESLVQRSIQRLAGLWAVDDQAELGYATAAVPRSRRPGDYRGRAYVSARGGFGAFLRKTTTFPDHDHKIGRDESGEIIEQLFAKLAKGGLVEAIDAETDGTPVYQVPADAMVWRVGSGKPYLDPIRMPTAPDEATVNDFFVELYETMAHGLVGITAREHTAQVPYADREEREEQFRSARLPVLYCSPTMELGVDIADLNVVNMRNVPPTPANYAQRSGRAGRSGQPALVFTYCSALSPHDQWFFHRPHLMVSGQVTPPRLDLANEDLVRSHVQAIWLGASGLSLGSSLRDVVVVGDPEDGAVDTPFQDSVSAALRDVQSRATALAAAERVLADIRGELEAAPWWRPDWLADKVLSAIPAEFDRATERWRSLYRSAMSQFDAQNRVIKDQSKTFAERQNARRLRREAEAQLELLAAEGDHKTQSDFYSYRYYASEGFLPGYSFPRLPLAAFIPGRRGKKTEGEYIQRPRFLAISEFGPQSLIYHEGARYRISRVILPVSDHISAEGEPALTRNAKRCTVCGYVHELSAVAAPDLCERCGSMLDGTLVDLFRMENVATRRQDRIISDEEERQRAGYELITGLRFATRQGRVSAARAEVTDADGTFARLTYGDTATIWRINLGWRRRKDKHKVGFVLDLHHGRWEAEPEAEPNPDDPNESATSRRVIPYVEDTRNCLLYEPAANTTPEVLASLQAALKQAIQVVFQLEDTELAAEPLPDDRERRMVLLYESAEGGAGVLRRLVEEPDLLALVADKALEICHFDPETGEDYGEHVRGGACEAACYECLMSYTNQLDHALLDRQAAAPLLRKLRASTVVPGTGLRSRDEQGDDLESESTTALERRWIEEVRAHGFKLPDRSQVYFEDEGTRPDFVYEDDNAVVYVDGPHHEFPDRAARDADRATAMRNAGWRVIRFGHMDDWSQIFDAFGEVFGVRR